MINQSSRIVFKVIAFVPILLSFACNTGTNNGNQNQIQNQNINQDSVRSTALAADACNDPDFGEKARKVKLKIIDKMSNKLKKQYRGDPEQNLPPTFSFEVRKSPDGDYLEAYFQGQVSGDEELKNLSTIVNDFQKDSNDKGCLLKVYFVPDGTLPINVTDRSIYFEWSACEYPLQACPNGLCADPCPGPLVTPHPGNTNGSSNSNTNSSNGNMNN